MTAFQASEDSCVVDVRVGSEICRIEHRDVREYSTRWNLHGCCLMKINVKNVLGVWCCTPDVKVWTVLEEEEVLAFICTGVCLACGFVS